MNPEANVIALLRVAGWDKHFECSQSRNLRRMTWVPVRVNLGGDGYSQLLDHSNGAAHFGAWIAIIEVAALCEPRGTLVRGNGNPHDAESLGRITRIPSQILSEAILRLLDIGWLQHDTKGSQQDTAGILQDAVAPQRKFVATGQDRTLQTNNQCASSAAKANTLTPQQEAWFSKFWEAYWLRRARKPARAAFGKIVTTEVLFGNVLAAVELQRAEMMLREPDRRPHAATWLSQERWNDEPATDAALAKTVYFDPAYLKLGSDA